MFPKTFAVLAFALTGFVAASPAAKRDAPLTCYFIATPTPDAGVAGLQASINYAVGHTIGVEYPNTGLTTVNSLVRHDDGTYDVYSDITVDGVAQADIATFVETWRHTTLDGLSAQWFVNAADCPLSS